jgi:hypothetical protein
MKGAWRLETAADLLRKLEHDFERMRGSPGDAYAAFDFFVTAEHLPEWTDPKCQHLRKDTPLLAVVSHIANNAKHFELDPRRHDRVEETSASYGALVSDNYFAKNYFARGWFGGKLGVQLVPAIAAELNLLQTVLAIELAERVLKFWQDRLGTA